MRADIYISMVMRSIIDPETKIESTEFVMSNMTDINGLVPKWIVNATSKAVPKIWFKTYQIGCQKYM